MPDGSTSQNEDGIFEPFDMEEVPWREASFGERFGMSFQHLSSYGGGEKIGISNEVLPPGKQANQHHYHMLEEEHLFVLEGSLTLRLGETEYILTPNHYVCFPAGQKVGHSLYNHTSDPCRYLIIGNPHPHDVIIYPETGRVGVELTREGYSDSARMDYWDGVEGAEDSRKS